MGELHVECDEADKLKEEKQPKKRFLREFVPITFLLNLIPLNSTHQSDRQHSPFKRSGMREVFDLTEM